MTKKLSNDELKTWTILKHGLDGYILIAMKHYHTKYGQVEVFLYQHTHIAALHETKIMVDGIEVNHTDFITQFELDNRSHSIELFRPFHFQAVFAW